MAEISIHECDHCGSEVKVRDYNGPVGWVYVSYNRDGEDAQVARHERQKEFCGWLCAEVYVSTKAHDGE